jgi:hypothetical protein
MLRELVNEETGWNYFMPQYTGDKGPEIIQDIDTLTNKVFLKCRVSVISRGLVYFNEEIPFEFDCHMQQYHSGRDPQSFGNMLLYERLKFFGEEVPITETTPIQIYCLSIPGMIYRPITEPTSAHIGGILKGAYATGKEEFPILRIDQLLIER